MEIETRATGLQAMREIRGLSRDQLGSRLGMTLEDVKSLEVGVTRPGATLRRALMAYFDCNFEDLFEVVMVHPDDRSAIGSHNP